MSAQRKPEIPAGTQYGNLTVIGSRRKVRKGHYAVAQTYCVCKCGNKSWIVSGRLPERRACRSCTTKHRRKPVSSPKYVLWLHVKETVYRVTAARRGLEFSLTREEFQKILQGTCVYCGVSPANGVDRKDNALGYSLLNAASCCAQCNYGKRDQTAGEFLDWVRRVHAFRGWDRR